MRVGKERVNNKISPLYKIKGDSVATGHSQVRPVGIFLTLVSPGYLKGIDQVRPVRNLE